MTRAIPTEIIAEIDRLESAYREAQAQYLAILGNRGQYSEAEYSQAFSAQKAAFERLNSLRTACFSESRKVS